MVRAGIEVHHEDRGEGLLIGRVGLLGRVRLTGGRPAFAPGDELGSCQRQQVAQFRGVDEVRRVEHALSSRAQAPEGHRANAVAVDIGGEGGMLEQQRDPARGDVRRHQPFKDGESHSRFVAQARDRAVAGIQVRAPARRVCQGVVAPVVVADAGAQFAIPARRTVRLDPLVLVGRHALLGELAADPVGFLGQRDAQARPGRGQRCRHAAQPSARNYHVESPRRGGGVNGEPVEARQQQRRAAGRAARRHPDELAS